MDLSIDVKYKNPFGLNGLNKYSYPLVKTAEELYWPYVQVGLS